MPLERAISRLIMALLGFAAAGCANLGYVPPPEASSSADIVPAALESAPEDAPTARMPREIQIGAVQMVIQRVEADVSRDEVAAAIGPMIANALVCMRWPALWIEEARRSSFVVRFDLMTRDWGEEAAAAGKARLDEFVEMGFLQEQLGDDPGVVTYLLTEAGDQHFAGILEPGRRPRFCVPAERRLVAITAMEWGETPCGTLLVSFTHTGDAWPSWARGEAIRARLEANWPAPGATVGGSVSLSRQWYRRQDLPSGVENGALVSACYDARRQEIVGDDLDLSLGSLD
jgi:hypothetical protein